MGVNALSQYLRNGFAAAVRAMDWQVTLLCFHD